MRWQRLFLWLAAAFTATSLSASSNPDDLVRSFVAALAKHDIHAFDPLALQSPINSVDWKWVRAVLHGSDCFTINGYRATIENAGVDRVRAIVDVDGTATTGANPPVLLATPWTLGLQRDAAGWHIAVASMTLREIDQTNWVGRSQWWQSCADESIVPPPIFAYHVADDASLSPPTGTRQIESLAAAEQMARDLRDPVLIAYCEMFRSRLAWAERTYDKALSLAQVALKDAEATGDYQVIVAAHFMLGLAYWKTGEIDKAIASLSYPVDLERLNNRRIELAKLALAAYIHLSTHNFRRALITTYRARTLAVTYGIAAGQAQADDDLGQIHEWLGDYETARQYYAEEVQLSRGLGGSSSSETLARLAWASLNTHRTQEAIEYFQKALEGDTAAWVKTAYAAALERMGRDAEAEKSLREAVDLAHRTRQGAPAADALTALGRIRLKQDRAAEALDLARRALTEDTASDRVADQKGDWDANLIIGRALLNLHDSAGAEAAFRKAIATIEAQRNGMPAEGATRFFNDRSEPYHALMTLLARQHRSSEGLRVSEQMRSVGLLDALSRQIEPEQPLSRDEGERYNELKRAVADANREVARLRKQHDRHAEERLRDARTSLDRYSEELALAHPQTVARDMAGQHFDPALPAGIAKATVVEYAVTDSNTILFVVKETKSGLRVRAHVIPVGRAAIRRRVRRFTDLLLARNYDYAATARALYRDFVSPAESALAGSGALIVIPDMELWQLPFQALLRPNGHHLVEDFAISYAPSLAALQAASHHRRPARGERTLLAFGNPTLSRSAAAELRAANRDAALGSLPDAEREVRTIARLYGPQRSRVYVGDEARKSTFKEQASGYDVLHLATHGLVDDTAPMYSALLLAAAPDDPDQDGLLTTREILQLRLKADLAVLAACNTGRGSIDHGEGVVGLSWAFLSAGCPSTVVAQWSVSSAATSDLMIQFHRSLIHGESKAAALRASQLAIMRQPRYRHPFYWASFILVGMP